MIGGMNTYRKKGFGGILMILSLLFGLYMINVPFKFVDLTEVLGTVHEWIIFAGGIVLIFSFFYILQRKMMGYY